MIDPKLCSFEDYYRDQDGYSDYYFQYPVDLSEAAFDVNEEDVVGMCICLTVNYDGEYYMQMAPTIETPYGTSDCDWVDLEPDLNYTEETVLALLALTKGE